MKKKQSPNQRGLGRGLGALIVNTQPAEEQQQAADAADDESILSVPTEAVFRNPHQPRTTFDQDALDELAASIREHGILQPLIVTRDVPAPASHVHLSTTYCLIAGERRLRAAQIARLAEIPVIVRSARAEQLMEWALIENVQREDLSPLEEAAAYRALMDELKLTQSEVADRVGKSRSAVANTVRLLLLSPAAQEALGEQQISAGHARALLGLKEPELMDQALSKIMEQSLNVRQTEALVAALQEAAEKQEQAGDDATDAKSPDAALDDAVRSHLARMENQFRSALGTKVNLSRGSDGGGRITIHFYSDDDLEQIYKQIAQDDDV